MHDQYFEQNIYNKNQMELFIFTSENKSLCLCFGNVSVDTGTQLLIVIIDATWNVNAC